MQGTVPPPNATNVVRNLVFRVAYSEAVAGPADLATAIRLVSSSGAALPLQFNGPGQVWPVSPLASNATYQLHVTSLTDLAGNPMQPYSMSFQTGSRTASYDERPQLLSLSPSSAFQVPLNPVLTATFDQPVTPYPNSQAAVSLSSQSVEVPIAVSMQNGGREMRIQPISPLQPGTTYTLAIANASFYGGGAGIYGYSGAAAWSPGTYSYTTAGTPLEDATAPQVIGVSPPLGSTSPVSTGFVTFPMELTFSEPMNSATATSDSILLLIDGHEVGFFPPQIGPDARSITVPARLEINYPLFQAGKTTAELTLIVTGGLQDLAGNPLASDFIASFQLQADITSSGSLDLHETRPHQDAHDIPADTPIDLILTSEFAPGNLNQAFYIAEDENLVSGQFTSLANNQVVRFTPAQPFAPGSVVQVFSRGALTTPDGSDELSYEGGRLGLYSIASLDQAAFEVTYISPRLSISSSPAVPSNAPITVGFSDLIDPSTVTPANFEIYDYFSAAAAPAALTVLPDGKTVRMTPTQLLTASRRYQLRVRQGARSSAGVGLTADVFGQFQAAAAGDVTVPSLISVSPPNGSAGVPLNAQVQLRFSEAMDPNSIRPESFQLRTEGVRVRAHDFEVDHNRTGFRLVPLSILQPNSLYEVSVTGARDEGGLAAPPMSWTFQTGPTVDTVRPQPDNQLSPPSVLPVGEPIRISYDEPLDPAALDPEYVRLHGGFSEQDTPVSISFENGHKTIVFTPQQTLAVGAQYALYPSSTLQDFAGNASHYSFEYRFTVGFFADQSPPAVTSSSIQDGETGVSPLFEITLDMSEPIDVRTVDETSVRLLDGATPLTIFREVENRTRLILRSPQPLTLGRLYVAELRHLSDLYGNVMTTPHRISFTTRAVWSSDQTAPHYSVNVDGAQRLFRNVAAKIRFDKRIDPASVRLDTVYYTSGGASLPGTPALDATGKLLTLTPGQALPANSAVSVVVTTEVQDFAGNATENQSAAVFSTSEDLTDTTPPTVVGLIPAQDSTNVPRAAIGFGVPSESLDPFAPTQFSTRILDANGAQVVAAPLPAATALVLDARGGYDFAGNPLTPRATGFTTGAVVDGTADPEVVGTNPVAGSIGASLNPAITVDFDQPLTPIWVYVQRFSSFERVPVSWSMSADLKRLTITPLQTLLPNHRYEVSFEGYNVVGKRLNESGWSGSFFSFTTTNVLIPPDPTPPAVLSVDPPDGAVDVANPEVTLTFSEPIDASTLEQGLALFFEGEKRSATVASVGDGSTAVLTPQQISGLNGQFSVVVTSAALDLSGNGAAPFLSRFTFTDSDPGEPVTSQMSVRPPSGAAGVSSDATIHFIFNGPIEPSSTSGAVLVSQNGVLISGSTSLSRSNHIFTFTPDIPYAPGSVVEAFLDLSALLGPGYGQVGNHISRTRFTVAEAGPPRGPLSIAVPGGFGWGSYGNDVPRDAQFLIRFNKPIDPATLNATSVALAAGGAQPAALELEDDGSLLRITPAALLPPTIGGAIVLKNTLLAIDGSTFNNAFTYLSFSVGVASAGFPPTVLISPPNGSVAVGVNAEIVLRFSGRVQWSTVNASTVRWTNVSGAGVPCTFSFSASNSGADTVTITPHDPFEALSAYTITVDGVEDLAGQLVPATTSTFTASAATDYIRPRLLRFSPEEFGAPRNTAVVLEVDEPVDANTITTSSIRLIDQTASYPNNQVPGSVRLESDSRTIVFLPDQLLEGNRAYRTDLDGSARDLSGNSLYIPSLQTTYFETDNRIDSGPPAVVSVLPAHASAGVALSSAVVVVFDRPLRPDSLDSALVRIESSGIPIPASIEIGGAGKAVILRPLGLFDPATAYSWSVGGVRDLAGTPMSGVASGSFTTGATADLTPPTLVSSSPAEFSSGNPRGGALTLVFAEPLRPDTVLDGSFLFVANGSPVPTQVTLSADGRTVTTMPATLPPAGATVSMYMSGDDWTDLSGNPAAFSVTYTLGN